MFALPSFFVLAACVACITSYVGTACTKATHGLVVDAIILLLALSCLSASVTHPTYPTVAVCAVVIVVAVLFPTPLWWLNVALGLGAHTLAALNLVLTVLADAPEVISPDSPPCAHAVSAALRSINATAPVLAPSNASYGIALAGELYLSTKKLQIAYLVGGGGISLLVLAGLIVVLMAHHDNLNARTAAAASLAAFAAERLRHYDTESVRTALAQHALTDANAGDTRLTRSLATLVANLELFRPHLPNWVLGAAAGDEVNIGTARRSSKAVVDVGVARPPASSTPPPEASPPPERVSNTSIVVFQHKCNLRTAGDALVNTVHSIARVCRGAVHSFAGGSVIVSFGATPESLAIDDTTYGRTWDHAELACRFLCQVRQDCARLEIGQITGAVVSGPASGRVCGNDGHSALLIQSEYEDSIWRLALRARECQTLLVDEATFNCAGHRLLARAVAAQVTCLPDLVAVRPFELVYEVLGELSKAPNALVPGLEPTPRDAALVADALPNTPLETDMSASTTPGETPLSANWSTRELNRNVSLATAHCVAGRFAAAQPLLIAATAHPAGSSRAVSVLCRLATECHRLGAPPPHFVQASLRAPCQVAC